MLICNKFLLDYVLGQFFLNILEINKFKNDLKYLFEAHVYPIPKLKCETHTKMNTQKTQKNELIEQGHNIF